MAIISNTYGKILATLLAWLGFSAILVSCTDYGCESTTYKVKGVTVSETDDTPIEGLRAVLKTPHWSEEGKFFGMDTVYTDSKGVFYFKTHDVYGSTLYVELADKKNGSFNDAVVVADFSHVKFKGSGCDHQREVEKDLGIIKMKPKK